MVPSTVLKHRKLTHSPLTSLMHGVDRWRDTVSWGDTLTCILALHRVSMLEFLAYNKLSFLLIVHLLISILRSTKKLWRLNFRKEDTLALS